MKTLMGIILVSILVSACKMDSTPPPKPRLNHVIHCVDGVEYLFLNNWREGYAAPHMKQDGTVYTCELEGNDE